MVNQVFYQRTLVLFERKITAFAFYTGNDIHVSIFGGDKGHIGAISAFSGSKEICTICFPNHHDDVISEAWAKEIRDVGIDTAVVEVGIHYDDISQEGILAVLSITNSLLKDFTQKLRSEVNGKPLECGK